MSSRAGFAAASITAMHMWAATFAVSRAAAQTPALAQATTSPAQSSVELLTLAAAVEHALAAHPSPQAAVAALDAARAATGEARAARWPTLRLQANATQYEEPALIVPLHGFTPGSLPRFDETLFHGSLVAGYTLFDGGARGARIRRAESQASGAAVHVEDASQALMARTIGAYLDVRTRQEILDAQDQRRAALVAERDRVQRRLQAGRAARVELLRVEAALARTEAERVQHAEAARTASADLARFVGTTDLPPLAPVALADTTLPDRQAALAAALAGSPSHAQASAQAQAASAGTRLARAARWPELRAQGVYQGWSDDEGHDALEWNVGAQLSWPLFTGGAVQSGIRRADAERRSAAANLAVADLAVAQDVDHALQRVAESHARVRSLRVAVERSTEVARIEALSLAAGSATQTDWLRAEADLLESRAGLAEARHGEIAARAELARVIGELDAEWIARTLERNP